MFDDHAGLSPDLTVRIGQTLVFDQRDPSNWMHPLGFAYSTVDTYSSRRLDYSCVRVCTTDACRYLYFFRGFWTVPSGSSGSSTCCCASATRAMRASYSAAFASAAAASSSF